MDSLVRVLFGEAARAGHWRESFDLADFHALLHGINAYFMPVP